MNLKSTFLDFYHGLARRRAIVSVLQAAERDPVEPPIFVIGTFRSGTTLLRYMLDSHPRITCPAESDFIAPLQRLLDDELYRTGFEALGFTAEHVCKRIRAFVTYFFQNYAAARGKPRWADKSPAYVDHLDFLRKLFPEAYFVFVYRHPLDQVESHSRSGTQLHWSVLPYANQGESPRIVASRYWVEKVARMKEFEKRDPMTFAIRYEELTRDPENVMRSLIAWLGEAWSEDMLDFHRFPHSPGREDSKIRLLKGIVPSTENYHGWPPNELDAALQIVGDLMQELGYEGAKASDVNPSVM